MNSLSDVEVTSPANNEVLTYESAASKWKNKPAGAGAAGLWSVQSEKRSLSYTINNYCMTVAYVNVVPSTTEAAHRLPFPACTAKKLFVKVFANYFDGVLTVTLRKNGFNTPLTLTVPALTMGTFTIVSDVVVAEGDELNYKFATDVESGTILVCMVLVFSA